MPLQLSESQLDAIRNHADIRINAFYWAEAIVQRHGDHAGDTEVDIWGCVHEALGIPTEGTTVSVTPVLVAVETIESHRENAPLARAIVWIVLDDTKQIIDLEWVDDPEPASGSVTENEYTNILGPLLDKYGHAYNEMFEAVSKHLGHDTFSLDIDPQGDTYNVYIDQKLVYTHTGFEPEQVAEIAEGEATQIKAADLFVAGMSDGEGPFVALIHTEPGKYETDQTAEGPPTDGTAHAARDWSAVDAIVSDMYEVAKLIWGPKPKVVPNTKANKKLN